MILTDPNVLNNCIRLINNSSTDFIYTKGLPVGLNYGVLHFKCIKLCEFYCWL